VGCTVFSQLNFYQNNLQIAVPYKSSGLKGLLFAKK